MASLRNALHDNIEVDSLRRLVGLGIRVQNLARRYCPVDTGRLRSSITTSNSKRDASGYYIEVGTNVRYAALVEFGTRRMRAQPYLRPAILAAAQRGMTA